MTQDRRSARALAALLPAGAFGLSVSLASDALQQYAKDGEPFVAIDPDKQLAWWGNGWHNGGWGWHNGGWHNGGWGNGWHNGGWGNGWHNGGWGNGWHNW